VYAQANTGSNGCSVFGTFDNCNNRANMLNGVQTDIPQQAGYCPGSCVGGTVSIVGVSGTPTTYSGAAVTMVGHESPYRTISTPGYALINITQTSLNSNSVQTIRAAPASDVAALYNPVSVEVNIPGPDHANDANSPFPPVVNQPLTLGFRATSCTNSCTVSTETVPTCHVQCYQQGNDNNLCSKNPAPSYTKNATYYAVLQACDGKPANFVVPLPGDTTGSKFVQCCTGLQDVNGQQKFVVINNPNYKVSLNVSASNVVKSTRVVYYNGKLVKLVVALFR